MRPRLHLDARDRPAPAPIPLWIIAFASTAPLSPAISQEVELGWHAARTCRGTHESGRFQRDH